MISNQGKVEADLYEALNKPLYTESKLDRILARVRNNRASTQRRKLPKINWPFLKEATALVADASAVAQLLGIGAILGSFGDQLIGLLSM